MQKPFIFFILLFIYIINAHSEKLDYPSLQWVKSNEYKMLCSQIYQSAQHEFDRLDLTKVTSVMIEQSKNKNLPLAIVTDIDETILLNYDFQKEILEKNVPFSYNVFNKFIDLGEEIPIKPSIRYFQYLSKHSIKIIYISNRLAKTEVKTYKYLKKNGYPISSIDDLLLQNEKENWGSNKSSRRTYISKRYTVIQMFGDNLKDFLETSEEAMKYQNKFGKSWFLLPNPIYGNWL